MRKHKASYIYRLGDELFAIYRLSHYSNEPLKAVAAGLAYTDQGDYSADFLRKIKKYGIDREDRGYEFLCKTRNDMCLSLYLQQEVGAKDYRLPEDQVPKRVLEFGESLMRSKIRKKEISGIRIISDVIDWLGIRVSDPKDAKEFLIKNYKMIVVD
jgi:hypothetical protein